MSNKLDLKILSFYQKLVDVSGLSRAFWRKTALTAVLITTVANLLLLLRRGDFVGVGLWGFLLFMLIGAAWLVLQDRELPRDNVKFLLDALTLVLSAVSVAMYGYESTYVLYGVSAVSWSYLMSCRNPPPPRKKFKLKEA